MRQDSRAFQIENVKPTKRPRYVVEITFDDYDGDKQYITSHVDAAVPDGVLSPDDEYQVQQNQQITLASPAANDYFGGSVAFSNDGQILIAAGVAFDGVSDYNVGRVKVYTRNSDGTYTLDETLLGSDSTADDHFGLSLHISGDGSTIVVGAPAEATTASDAGAFYIFQDVAGTWTEVDRIEPTGIAAGDGFGWKMGISYDGNVILASSPFDDEAGTDRGSVWVYQTDDDWTTNSETKLTPQTPGDSLMFGYGATLSDDGNVAFIADRYNTNQGRVFIFARSGRDSAWPTTETQSITAADGESPDYFGAAPGNDPLLYSGSSLACSANGDHLFVGAYGWDRNASEHYGAVYYFYRQGLDNWIQEQRLEPDAGNGQYYTFGYKLDVTPDAQRLVIGSQSEHGDTDDVGAFYLFENVNGTYEKRARVLADTPAQWEYAGFSVAMDASGKTIASGATDYTDTQTSQGCVRIYDASAPVAYAGLLKSISGTSQRVDPLNATSSIGAINFEVADVDSQITNLLNNRNARGYGVRNKRVRVYVGYRGLAWSDYALVATQVIQKDNYSNGRYRIHCEDIQRSIKEDIFEPKETNLTASLTLTATTVEVVSTTGFQMLEHGASFVDSPSATVGYIRVEDEVIKYTGITSNSFTGCTRGALGSTAAEHTIDATADQDKTEAVTEFIYIEMPAVKLLYAILTGYLYGQGVAKFPDHWHLNISTAFVATSQFLNHPDWYDSTDDTAGVIPRFAGLEKEDGKQFIQREILRLLGAWMPVLNDGQLGFKRMTGVLSNASVIAMLDDDNVTRHSGLTHDGKQVKNVYKVRWNHDYLKGKRTRVFTLIDPASISKNKVANTIELDFKGLHGSRHTRSIIGNRFDALRDRYAGPPELLPATCKHRMNTLDAGDIVGVNLSGIRNYSQADPSAIRRAMEIQSKSINWLTGEVTLQLFGSSHAASSRPGTDGASGLAASYYTAEGTDISTVLTSSVTGGVLHVTADGSLTGLSDLSAAAAATDNSQGKFYYNGDIEFDDGITIDWTHNIEIRVNGFVQINGLLEAIGAGIAGVAYSWTGDDTVFDITGTPGFIGNTRATGGIGWYLGQTDVISHLQAAAEGVHPVAPSLELTNDGTDIGGLYADGRGTSGGPGGPAHWPDFLEFDEGGDGGAGGGSIRIICKGAAFGPNGRIDVSGEPGTAPPNPVLNLFGYNILTRAGGGASGHPGTVYFILDGADSLPPVNRVTANFYAPRQSNINSFGDTVEIERARLPVVSLYDPDVFQSERTFQSYFLGQPQPADVDVSESVFRVQYIPENITANEDTPSATVPPTAISVVPVAGSGSTVNLVGLEISVTAPSASNYFASDIYVRKLASGVPIQGWQLIGRADGSNEVVFYAPADGATYDVKAHPVSITNVVSDNFYATTFAVSSSLVTEMPSGNSLVGSGNMSGNAADETLAPNGFFDDPITGTWFLIEGTAPTTTPTIANDVTEGNYLNLPENAANGYGYGSKTFRLIPGKKYRFRIRAKHDGGAGTDDGFYFRLQYKDTFVDPMIDSERDGNNDFIAGTDTVITNAYATYEFDYVVPAGANWGNIALYNWTQSTVGFQVAFVEVVSLYAHGDVADYGDESSLFYFPAWWSLDGLYTSTVGGGAVTLNPGGGSGAIQCQITGTTSGDNASFTLYQNQPLGSNDWSKNRKLKTVVVYSLESTSDAAVKTGSGGYYFGFIYESGQWKAISFNNSAPGTKTNITITSGDTVEAVFYAADRIEYFVNGSLVATHTTDLPTGSVNDEVIFASSISRTATGTGNVYIRIGETKILADFRV